ncbi:MAG: anthranilate synthase component I [Bryobacterales bacterium]|nr:anthranilate synthase component I [Bryobacterales bacterium]
MANPDLQTFHGLAEQGNLIPVWKVLTADLETPVSAYLKLAEGADYAFLLESVEGGERIGRYTYVGASPYMIVRALGDGIEVREGGAVRRLDGDFFAVLKDLVGRFHPVGTEGLPPFSAGAVGYAGYDLVRRIEPRVPPFRVDDVNAPDAVFMFFTSVLVFDHVKHQIYVIANARIGAGVSTEDAYRSALAQVESLEACLRGPVNLPGPPARNGPLDLQSNIGKEAYCAAVEKAREYIHAGDIFQVVLSQRLEMVPGVHPFQIYRALRTVNPSPYLFYLQLGDRAVVGSSPELLVKVDGSRVEYRPIAGTRPRGATREEDRALAEDLLSDEKELAEHVMLVDLGRNDIGRVSEYGSVRVPEFKIVEYYSHVMHIVSSVLGTLRADRDAFDTLKACFPAGTVSGAPKVRAMEIIAELEPTKRGVYSGSVMYLDFSGSLTSAIAIRTMMVSGEKAYLQVGAGIVADSVPEREWEETMNKAGALLRAVELARGL